MKMLQRNLFLVFVIKVLTLPPYKCTDYVKLKELGFVDRLTTYGRVRGVAKRVNGVKTVEIYLGIRYAQPPIGKNRFETPIPPEPWGEKIRLATTLPPACPQEIPGLNYIRSYRPDFNDSSEDCLFLNVYVPQGAKGLLPVLVFIHGGSYKIGSSAMFDGTMLAMEDIVVVSFNYRLGILGYLTTVDDEFPGNYGMLDQIEALKWVQSNIHYFSGDKNQVTIDGHSAGATSVGLLQLSPLARGLFDKVILQSGSPIAFWAVNKYQVESNFAFKELVSELKCHRNSSRQIKMCLQRISSQSFERISAADMTFTPSLVPKYQPRVDGHFLPDLPENLILNCELNAVKVFLGTTRHEGLAGAKHFVQFLNEANVNPSVYLLLKVLNGDLPAIKMIVDKILSEYIKWPVYMDEDETRNMFSEIIGDYFIRAPMHRYADLLWARGVQPFVYSFDYQSIDDSGVPHGDDVFYISGTPLIGHKYIDFNENDQTMSKMIMESWANFAKSGEAFLSDGYRFKPYSTDEAFYTIFTSIRNQPSITYKKNLEKRRLDFWNRRIPELYQLQYNKPVTVYNLTKSYPKILLWTFVTSSIVFLTAFILSLVIYHRTKKRLQMLLRWKAVEII